MKKIAKLITMIAFAGLFIACGNNQPKSKTISGQEILSSIGERSFAGAFGSLKVVDKFKAADINISNLENIQLKSRESLSLKDRENVSEMIHEFVNADNKNQLELGLMISESPVEDAIYVLAIEMPKAENISIQIYNEEGFEITVNNRIPLEEGTNYKALNLKSLESGQYILLLEDDFGREIMQNLPVRH